MVWFLAWTCIVLKSAVGTCRYPKAWEERAADAKAKEAKLRELLAIQRQQAHATFRTPF